MTKIRLPFYAPLFWGGCFSFLIFFPNNRNDPHFTVWCVLVLVFGFFFLSGLRFTFFPIWAFDEKGIYKYGFFSLDPKNIYTWSQVTKIGMRLTRGRGWYFVYALFLDDPKTSDLRFQGSKKQEKLGNAVRYARIANPNVEVDPRVLDKIKYQHFNESSLSDLIFQAILISAFPIASFIFRHEITQFHSLVIDFLSISVSILTGGYSLWSLFLFFYKWKHRKNLTSYDQNSQPITVTYILLAILSAVFAVELKFSFDPFGFLLTPTLHSLIAFGASSRDMVFGNGEWYRLFTSMLLHGNLLHIFCNGMALYFAGFVLEAWVGGAWFFVIFFLSGLCGSLASVYYSPVHIVSVGASGAIMGLMSAAIVIGLKLPKGDPRKWKIGTILFSLIFALIPSSSVGMHIDYSAHTGGAICGVVLALFLLIIWNDEEKRPGMKGLSWILALFGLMVLILAASVPMRAYSHDSELATLLLPENQIPKSYTKAVSESAKLVVQYPHDPQTHSYRAQAYLQVGNYALGNRELKKSLAEKEILRAFYKPEFVSSLELQLAEVLIRQGRRSEAREVAKPLCEGQQEENVSTELKKFQLCD